MACFCEQHHYISHRKCNTSCENTHGAGAPIPDGPCSGLLWRGRAAITCNRAVGRRDAGCESYGVFPCGINGITELYGIIDFGGIHCVIHFFPAQHWRFAGSLAAHPSD